MLATTDKPIPRAIPVAIRTSDDDAIDAALARLDKIGKPGQAKEDKPVVAKNEKTGKAGPAKDDKPAVAKNDKTGKAGPVKEDKPVVAKNDKTGKAGPVKDDKAAVVKNDKTGKAGSAKDTKTALAKTDKTDKAGAAAREDKAGKIAKAAPKASREHVVQAHETLFRVAARYDLSVEQLRRMNGVSGKDNSIRPGQRLRVSM